jgi:hypothetical protein
VRDKYCAPADQEGHTTVARRWFWRGRKRQSLRAGAPFPIHTAFFFIVHKTYRDGVMLPDDIPRYVSVAKGDTREAGECPPLESGRRFLMHSRKITVMLRVGPACRIALISQPGAKCLSLRHSPPTSSRNTLFHCDQNAIRNSPYAEVMAQ